MTSFSQVKPDTWHIFYVAQASLCLAKYVNFFIQYGRKSLCCSGLQRSQKQSGRTGFECESNRQNERSVGPVCENQKGEFLSTATG